MSYEHTFRRKRFGIVNGEEGGGGEGSSLEVPVLIRPQTMTFMGTILGLVAFSSTPPFGNFAIASEG